MTFYAGIVHITTEKLWNTNFSEENEADKGEKLWIVLTVRVKSTNQDRIMKAISIVAKDVEL